MKKRILAALMTLCILFSLIPVSVMAANTDYELENISLSAASVKAPATIEVVATMSGDQSAVDSLWVSFFCEERNVLLYCDLFSDYWDESAGTYVRYEDGTFHGFLGISEYMPSSEYVLDEVTVVGIDGSEKRYTQIPMENTNPLPDHLKDLSIKVKATNPDTTPPTPKSISISSPVVSCPGTLTVTMNASDDKAGLSNAFVRFTHAESGQRIYCYLEPYRLDEETGNYIELPEGELFGTIDIDETDNLGEYNLTSIQIDDLVFNSGLYHVDPQGVWGPMPDNMKGLKFTVVDGNTPIAELAQPYTKSGETAKVTVSAKDAVSYQWYIKNAGKDSFSKSSVTKAAYSCEMNEKSKDRQVYCEVTDSEGNIYTSNIVTLKMAATVTTQPKNTYTKSGETAKVSVKAEGDGLTYQWYIKNAGAKKYSKSSVTKATYSCKLNEKSKDRYVYCVVTDQYGNTEKSKTVVLREAVSIVTEPKTGYAKSGKSVKVKVEASGDDLTYTWYIKNAGAEKYSKSSVTSATYSAKMSDKVNGRRVYCVVTDKYGKTVQSKTVVLRMAATITTQPKDVTVEKGKTAKVTVKAVGDDLTYTWYIKNEGASKFSKSSVTKATYSVKMSDKADGRQVYCVVTDKYGKTAKSNTVTLSMAASAVYANEYGTKYHYDPDCAGKTAYEISLSDAIAAGKTPCSKCVD